MGTGVERPASVSGIGVRDKVGIRPSRLEKVGKLRLKFRSKEITVARFLLKRGPKERREFTSIVKYAKVGKLRSATATDG